jgi:hypothetical protein
MIVQIPRVRFATACAALASIFLAACGSAPDTANIAKQFSGGCGAMVFKDFKKVDGAEAQNKLYEVAYTFRAEIKGGKAGALDLLTKWISLDQQIEQLGQDNTMEGGAYRKQVDALEEQKAKLHSGCENMEVYGWMTTLLSATRDNLRGGQTTVPVPYAVDLVGGGLMKKAESGWVFEQLPPHRIANVVQSDPAPFAVAAPPAAKPQSVSTADQTLIGILKSGSVDSCFEVISAGGGTKCYGFPADGPVAKALITACGQGDRCAVIGRFNDAKEEIESIKSANKAG